MIVPLRTVMVAGHVFVLAMCLSAIERARGSDPVTIRVLDPQGLEAGIFNFPDRDDVGTGTFESNIPPGALAIDPFVRVGAAAPADGPPGEIPRFRLYDLRHTFATHLLAQGRRSPTSPRSSATPSRRSP
jgi:integrase